MVGIRKKYSWVIKLRHVLQDTRAVINTAVIMITKISLLYLIVEGVLKSSHFCSSNY